MRNGKKVRMSRLFHPESGHSIIVPMDHGATMGPLPGLTDMRWAVARLRTVRAHVQGIVLHRGTLRHIDDCLPTHELPPRVLHVSCSTSLDPSGHSKSLVAQVEDAVQMGADAVSVHINLNVPGERDMLRDFGRIASACDLWGMPLLAMMYVRPKGVTSTRTSDLKLAARVGAEIGADLVKVSYPGSAEGMQEIVEGCFVPVLVAGGELSDTTAALVDIASKSIRGGAAGLCIGRNVFQAAQPAEIIAALGQVVHESTPNTGIEAARILRAEPTSIAA